MSDSAWQAEAARKEHIVQAGLASASQFERDHGPFTPEELAEASEWAAQAIRRADRADHVGPDG
jgi:hypothetical protein